MAGNAMRTKQRLQLLRDLCVLLAWSPVLCISLMLAVGFQVYGSGVPPRWADPVLNGVALGTFVSLAGVPLGIAGILWADRRLSRLGTVLLSEPAHVPSLARRDRLGPYRVRLRKDGSLELSRSTAPALLRLLASAGLAASVVPMAMMILAHHRTTKNAAGVVPAIVVLAVPMVAIAIFLNWRRTTRVWADSAGVRILTFGTVAGCFGVDRAEAVITPPVAAQLTPGSLSIGTVHGAVTISGFALNDMGRWEMLRLVHWLMQRIDAVA
jgi:hypothetical protein